ncbi:glycoside hydrolase family 16 protein [Marasmius fiardii PR-910]|nr:glycoside hydrolase family 16 protein [Marasmius fiardii PR-910]
MKLPSVTFLILSLFSLPFLCLAGHRRSFDSTSSFRRNHHGSQTKPRNIKYALQDKYCGEDIINQWNFFSEPDPTHGMVDYQNREDAIKKGLAYVQKDGTTVLAVDNTSNLPPGKNRASVRISSPKTYNQGLFVADFWAMPFGCSVWPAYWSVGPDWPNGGEIDVLEGVHNSNRNQLTVHTSLSCTLDPGVKPQVSTTTGNSQCATINGDNSGCPFFDDNPCSYGQGFNQKGGGVYVHLWDSEGIKAWFFPRDSIPKDITELNPHPGSPDWGKPVAFWENGDSCDVGKHFYEHELVIDTTLCGDWAGSTYESAGCPGKCGDAVQNPRNYDNAKWKINYIAVYHSA